MYRSKEFLKRLGMPTGDCYNLKESKKRFDDGGQYRFEVPGIQGPASMTSLVNELSHLNMSIHRITQTKGIMLLTDSEITEMVQIAKDCCVELVLAIGPRATTDTSASVNTPEGQRMGYRLRGQDQILRAMEEVYRGVDLGCKSFLVYDEGALWIFNEMRKNGEIPENVNFKVSAHSGHGNPCSARLLESIGANSFNPVRDIQLQMMSSIRQTIDIPMDIHTENPTSTGGFIRHYEVPEMIKVASPIYLKTGGSVAKTHSHDTNVAEAKQRAKQVSLVQRMIDAYYPDALISK